MYCPKVSVLMSVYNNEATVDASVRSIVDQTFQDWEMILFNDASTDETLSKLLAWQEADSRIKVYSNSDNIGIAASLNKALKEAKGEYIARMDGDDVAFPERFEKQVAFLDGNEEFAFVSSGCILVDEDGQWGTRNSMQIPSKHDFLWGSQFLHPATILRREVLVSVDGYRVCKDTRRTEDYDLFMRLYASGYIGYNIAEPLLYYYESRKPRSIKYYLRWRETKVRYLGFKKLGLLPKGWPYVIKPLIIGLLPGGLKRSLQQQNTKEQKGSKN